MVADGYKQTDIGVIPKGWSILSMGEVGENIAGLTYSPNDVSEYGTLVLRSSNIQNNQLAYDNNVFVSMDLPSRVIVRENDLLICVRNGSKRLIGKCTLIDNEVAGNAFGAFMSVYRSIYNDFIFQMFQSNIIMQQIDETMGATINQLTNKDLSAFKIPFPPKKEQKAIATALSDTDALIHTLEKLIVKKEAIKTGTMQELLTGKKRLDGDYIVSEKYRQTEVGLIPEDWKIEQIGNVCQINGRIGFRGYTVNDIVNSDRGVITISPSNIQNNKTIFDKCTYLSWYKYEESPEIKIYNGDILLVKTGSTVGKTALVKNLKEKATLNPQIVVLKKIRIDNIYLSYIASHRTFQNQILKTVVGGAIPTLSQKQVANFVFPMPMNIEEQKAIAIALSNMDEEIESLKTKLSKLKAIKEGMMQELLTGKSRLV